MATSQKRPRIDAALAQAIDAQRGRVPFEPYVNDLIGRGLHNQPSDAREALEYIAVEHCQMDLKEFDQIVGGVRAKIQATLDDLAFESEHTDELGGMDAAMFDRICPTDEDKRKWYRDQNASRVKMGLPLIDPAEYGHAHLT